MTSAAEKRHLSRVAALSCVVCRNEGLGDTPAEVHHIRNGYGRGQKAPHSETLPLCIHHHRAADGSARCAGHVAFHKSPEEFERRYGTERELLAQVRRELGL
jgi:hypothetical protein